MMRALVVAMALVLVLFLPQQGCRAARDLRQATVQCPKELAEPVLKYMQTEKYKQGVAKACVKRDRPNCYLDCICATSTVLGAVLASEGQSNHPALLDKYVTACMLAFANKVYEDVMPSHVRTEQGSLGCLGKTIAWANNDQQTLMEKCPAAAEYVRDSRSRLG